LKKIRKLIGPDRELHVQVVAADVNGIVADAERIVSELGRNTSIKIPVSKAGIEAIRILSTKGYLVTATAVYTTMQGLLAVLAGARYIAVYCNRMENQNIDPAEVIGAVAQQIETGRYKSEILCASFKNIRQVVEAYESGAQGCTVSFDLLETALEFPSILKAVSDFNADWKDIHGEKTVSEL
jgi:TalC/MipB family fructose-6-phosphate aldolase